MARKKEKTYRRLMRLAGAALVLVLLATVVVLGWQWQAHLKVERIAIEGVYHAEQPALLELARVDTSMHLFATDPALVADRVERHPWVRAAHVTRLPTGTLRIRVQERTPVALVLGSEGVPSHYLDAGGFQMPLAADTMYDVPLLQGFKEVYHPVRRIENRSVRALLTALRNRHSNVLISDLAFDSEGEVWLYTAPDGPRGSVPVRLGNDGFEEKLQQLEVFWQQAVAERPPGTQFEMIDLRFEGQIVTREKQREGTS